MTMIHSNPYSAVKVFLSHSLKDYRYSDYLYSEISNCFDVFYDRGNSPSRSTQISDPLVSGSEILNSDIFIFLLSEHSFHQNCYAFDEYRIAKNSRPDIRPLMAIIMVEDFPIPDEVSYNKCERIRWDSREKDTLRIISSINNKISKDFGIISKSLYENIYYQFEGKVDEIIDSLMSKYLSKFFIFNFHWPAISKYHFQQSVNTKSKEEQNKIIDKLLSIYHSQSYQFTSVQRENALVLLSKISNSEPHIIQEITKKAPDINIPSFYRGFQVSLALLGDQSAIPSYIYNLRKKKDREWNTQRNNNRDFHLLYYNGLESTLCRLRLTIKEKNPQSLLPMNVYTLGELSDFNVDIETLEEERERLRNCGVDIDVTNEAMQKIKKRINS